MNLLQSHSPSLCPCSDFLPCVFIYHLLLSLSHVRLYTPWTAACQASVSFTISQSLLKLISIEFVMPSNHLILCPPLLLLPSIFPSIMVFPNESALRIRWSKYWRFSFSNSSFNEYPGLISSRTDWFALLAVQRTLKNLLQHHSSKASILQHSTFFMIQLSHLCMTIGEIMSCYILVFHSNMLLFISMLYS